MEFKDYLRLEYHKRRLAEMKQKLGRHDPLVVAQERMVMEMIREDYQC